MRSLLLLSCLLALNACSIDHQYFGKPLPAREQLDALRVGETTKSEALALLGAPMSLRRQFDGELLVWRRNESHAERLLLIPLFPIYERTWGRGGSDRLALLFNTEGLLAGVGVSLETASAEEAAEHGDDG